MQLRSAVVCLLLVGKLCRLVCEHALQLIVIVRISLVNILNRWEAQISQNCQCYS